MIFEAESLDRLGAFERGARLFPNEVIRPVLYDVGEELALKLYRENLRGQRIMYHATEDAEGLPIAKQETKPTKSGGRRSRKRMVRYFVNKMKTDSVTSFVTITSFPLNLFENGRRLRSGRREPGRHILRDFKRSSKSFAEDIAYKALKTKYGTGANMEKVLGIP
jgi:hypothetical protein